MKQRPEPNQRKDQQQNADGAAFADAGEIMAARDVPLLDASLLSPPRCRCFCFIAEIFGHGDADIP